MKQDYSDLIIVVRDLTIAMMRMAHAVEDLQSFIKKEKTLGNPIDETRRQFELIVLRNVQKHLGEDTRCLLRTNDVIDEDVQKNEKLLAVQKKVGNILRKVSFDVTHTRTGNEYLINADLVAEAIAERTKE